MLTLSMTRKSIPVRGSRRFRREEGGTPREQGPVHVPVMLKEVVAALQPKRTDVLLDATYGRGGHAKALRPVRKLIAIDADPSAGVTVANFKDIPAVLKAEGVETIDKALFDLGWNRDQLALERGFSFLQDEPLLMSYGPEPASGFFARDILNTWNESAIADALFGYGGERYSRRIAKAVVERRKIMPFNTTFELVELIRDAVPAGYRHGRLHFATRTFQALRIAVNDELRVLETGLAAAWKHLACQGRIAVITFHSVEDRVVKHRFVEFKKHGGTLLSKKPLTPTRKEIITNPAARSAKLRVIEKICNE